MTRYPDPHLAQALQELMNLKDLVFAGQAAWALPQPQTTNFFSRAQMKSFCRTER